MKIAITGAGGFIGSNLKNYFPDFIEINRNDNEKEIVEKLKDVDIAFNLAGASILKRWSENYKNTLFKQN
ncbi:MULTISPECIES: hypothetical protein [unclassified Lebetimonas]|uniref:hypothetical protein n=1 Tax=unclassified Lebetimonas TaxID=2648158 RepID=UPI0004B28FD0|nr:MULTISPECIES: hypothetical protein [unclassified Lebetimonas]